MKIKFNLLILFVLLFINIINGYIDRCVPNYKYEDASCDTQAYLPEMTIFGYNLFDQVLIEPTPIFERSFVGGEYIVSLDFNSTYTFTFKSRFCDSPVIVQQNTSTNYMLIVQQPKCINSYAVINFVNQDNTQIIFINSQPVEFPYEMLYNIDQNIISFGCSRSFYLQQPSNQGLPKFSITHSKCSQGGKLSIENIADYSSVIVNNFNGSVIDSDDNGLYESLEPGVYSVHLESNQCGKQLFNITIDNIKPSYQLVLLNDSCPTEAEYQFILDGENNYELVYGGSVVSNPFTFSFKYTSLLVNIDQCDSLDIPIELIYSIPPIHYTINPLSSNALDFCDGRYNVTLVYDSNLVQDFVVYSKMGQIEEIISPENNSFEISNDNYEYYIKSTCHSEPIKIVAPSRKPHFTVSNSTQYCNELVDITVSNYLDFTVLQLVSSNGVTYLSKDGVFRQVPNQYYTLQYIYRNCREFYESISIGSLNNANVYYKTNIIQYPTCINVSVVGLVEFIFYDNFTNNQLWTSVEEFSFYDVSPLSFIINYNNISCSDILVSLEFTLPEPDFTVKTVSKSLCNYSDRNGGGLIEIITNYPIELVSINDESRENLPVYRVKGGLNTIQIYYGGACTNYFGFGYYTSEAEFSDFNISYSLTPNDNCSEKNGAIKVNDYNRYNKLQIDGEDLLENSGQSYNKSSGTFTLDFEIQLGNSSQICSGSRNIFIPTSFDVDIQYNIRSNKICKDSYTEFDITSIKDKNGKEYVYDLSYYYSSELESYNEILKNLQIKSGNCSWIKDMTNITFTEVDKPFITMEVDETFVKECIAYTRYRFNYIDSRAAFYTYNYYLYYQYQYKTVSSNSGEVNLDIDYLNCTIPLNLKPILPILPTIKYSIQFNGDPSCLSSYTSINISVADYQNYSSLTYNGIPIGSNGVFSNVRPGYYIYGTLFNFDCQLNTQVLADKPFISNSKTVVNETCYSSLNGELSINQNSNDSDYYYLLQNNGDYYTDEYSSYYPVSSDQDLSSFTLLGSQDLRIIKVNKLHPTCLAYEEFTMNANEPEIITTISTECENGTIYSSLINSNLSGYYSLINYTLDNSTPSQTILPQLLVISNLPSSSSEYINSKNVTYTNLKSGNYAIVYEIKDDICRRKFISPVPLKVDNCNIDIKDDRLGLKIGLPIGLFFLAAFVGVGIYLYKKKLHNSKSNSVKMSKINH